MSVTLVPEDGTGLATSNTFVDVTAWQAYCDNRGYDYLTPGYTDDDIGAALVKAGEYLNNESRFLWRGQRVLDEQGMCWPRTGARVLYGTGNALASNLVPQKVKDAQCYIAWKQLSVGDVQPDLDRGGSIASVNAGGVSVSFQEKAMNETLYQVATGILSPYLRRLYYTITPTLVSDDRGYEVDSNASVSNGVEDRPGSGDTA